LEVVASEIRPLRAPSLAVCALAVEGVALDELRPAACIILNKVSDHAVVGKVLPIRCGTSWQILNADLRIAKRSSEISEISSLLSSSWIPARIGEPSKTRSSGARARVERFATAVPVVADRYASVTGSVPRNTWSRRRGCPRSCGWGGAY